jgi:hypothetical protein
MALIIRLDVDRPYGAQPLARHILSRVSSDLCFPRVAAFGFLAELKTMLNMLNEAGVQSYVFFRRCTLPSESILELLDAGGHQIGLHLENSRSFTTFLDETWRLEHHTNCKVLALSKHGSGGGKFGRCHYAPYEPGKYVEWARRTSMRLFLGNLEDPTLAPEDGGCGLTVFPSAFWLEPHWRDTKRFTVNWLVEQAQFRNIVLLVHPENVLSDEQLTSDFKMLIRTVEFKVFHE